MKKAPTIALALVLMTVAYTIAFQTVERKDLLTSFYWTIITMATIGYGDVTPQTIIGKILAIMIAISGIAIYTAFASVIVDYITERNIKRLQGLLSVKGRDHIVIIGWNEATKEAIKELKAAVNCEVVVISDKPVENKCVVGDFTDENVLKKAGVERAKYVIISTGDDSKTVLTTLIVKKINPKVKVIAEVLRLDNMELLSFAGADTVVLSEGFAGRLLASAVFESSVVRFFEEVSSALHGEDVFEISADEFAGLKVLDAMIKLKKERNLTLVGIVKRDVIVNPKYDKVIDKGDKLIVIGSR